MKKKLTPKQVKSLVVAAVLLLLIIMFVVSYLWIRGKNPFQPYKRTWNEIKSEEMLSVEEDKIGNISYEQPISIIEKETDIQIIREE